MDCKQVTLAISRVGHPVAYMAFLTLGRGNVMPVGAQWFDGKPDTGWWTREPHDINVMREIEATPALGYGEGVTGWRVLKPGEAPEDRTYRDAFRDVDGTIVVDVGLAKAHHLRWLRAKRAEAMPALDAAWMRAVGQGKTAERDAIEAKRQAWRDAPADPRIDAAQTVDELKAVTGP